MKLKTPTIPLWEVSRAIRTTVPPEPRTVDPAVLSRLTPEMQSDYHRECIGAYGARADAWNRRAEAWLWLLWITCGVCVVYFIALVVEAAT